MSIPAEPSVFQYEVQVFNSEPLMVAVSCGLTLQICLIIALSFRCRRWRQGFVTGHVSLAWSQGIVFLRIQVINTHSINIP